MRRLVIGSATFALVAAMAVLAPTGASAAASHSSDRTRTIARRDRGQARTAAEASSGSRLPRTVSSAASRRS